MPREGCDDTAQGLLPLWEHSSRPPPRPLCSSVDSSSCCRARPQAATCASTVTTFLPSLVHRLQPQDFLLLPLTPGLSCLSRVQWQEGVSEAGEEASWEQELPRSLCKCPPPTRRMHCQVARKHKWVGLLALTMDGPPSSNQRLWDSGMGQKLLSPCSSTSLEPWLPGEGRNLPLP